MQLKRMRINATIAREFLKKNKINRRLRDKEVKRYARVMKDGRWDEESPATIAFNKKGHFIDGQHRLHAIILSRTALWMNVVYDCGNKSFDYLDNGKTRSAGDTIYLAGVTFPTEVASGARQYMMYDAWRNGGRPSKFENYQVGDFVKSEPFIVEAAEFFYKHRKVLRIYRSGPAIGCFMIFHKINQVDCKKFMQYMAGLLIPESTSPLMTLHSKMIRESANRDKPKTSSIIVYIIKAWNAWRKGETLFRIQYGPTESFPKAR